jgi:hypothetical protein
MAQIPSIWFSLKKLNKVKGKEKYRIDISNMIVVLKDFGTEVVDINSV